MIRLNLPFLDQRELEEIAKVLSTGYLTQGSKTAEFEKIVAQYIGSRYAFAMSSCTTALHLSLVAAGIGPGDDVLLSDFTFPATANVVVQQKACPILVDVHLDTFNMDPRDLERKITPNSKAIIPVHAFGLSADMDAIMDIAHRHGLLVIEDAACALGARYKNQPCGTIGDIGCFSFHPRKSITTGEGGMIVTDNDDFAEQIKILRSHGGIRDEYYYRFEAAGFNYRMSDLQAAIGVAQMEKIDWILTRKHELAVQLKEMLSYLQGIVLPTEPEESSHTFQSFVILLDEAYTRDKVIASMRRQGVETTLGTYALHAQPFFQRQYGYASGDLPISYRIFRQSLTLPLYPQMTPNDLEQIVDALAHSLEEVGQQIQH